MGLKHIFDGGSKRNMTASTWPVCAQLGSDVGKWPPYRLPPAADGRRDGVGGEGGC